LTFNNPYVSTNCSFGETAIGATQYIQHRPVVVVSIGVVVTVDTTTAKETHVSIYHDTPHD